MPPAPAGGAAVTIIHTYWWTREPIQPLSLCTIKIRVWKQWKPNSWQTNTFSSIFSNSMTKTGFIMRKLTSWGFQKCGSFWVLKVLNQSYWLSKLGPETTWISKFLPLFSPFGFSFLCFKSSQNFHEVLSGIWLFNIHGKTLLPFSYCSIEW